MHPNEADSVSAGLGEHLARVIADHGGWLPFDRYMAAVLYTPGLGYYARPRPLFGADARAGSDFVTAPELSPLFARALAVQLQQALAATGVDEVWEFGAGSGALAEQLLPLLEVRRYTIVDVSGALRQRQRERLVPFGEQVRWVDELPAELHAVVIGNEVLDAMPVQLLAFDGARWHERGVVQHAGGLAFADRPTDLRPPVDPGFAAGSVTEIHPQAEAFIRTLSGTLQRGAAFFIDYGFPDHEYYHPQREGGTLMCHRAHTADTDPLAHPGDKDLSAHVNFSAIALAAQEAGAQVLGYTSQARFLLNCGLARLMEGETDPRTRAPAHKLIAEHEMGELFKVIGFAPPASAFDAIGFARGDRSHRL
jgi:SAM-dependent MidA family methyltransferase